MIDLIASMDTTLEKGAGRIVALIGYKERGGLRFYREDGRLVSQIFPEMPTGSSFGLFWTHVSDIPITDIVRRLHEHGYTLAEVWPPSS